MRVTAFGPASVGNVAVGFDILGHAVDALGDRVTVERIDAPEVRVRAVTGVVRDLPLEAERNTAGRAVMALRERACIAHGFELSIDKGIPLGSGLGGSAASAVAAVVGANALLDAPRAPLELLRCAMAGEAVASGAAHVDNIAACLYGGLVLTVGIDDPRVKRVPVPPGIVCVLVHPQMYLGTREARAILRPDVTRSDFVWQTANLAGFISGCYSNDLDMIRASFDDVVIEPQRQSLIPGFGDAKRAALAAGALGCSISGAGPTVFAWADATRAPEVRDRMVAAFTALGHEVDHWISAIAPDGARVVA